MFLVQYFDKLHLSLWHCEALVLEDVCVWVLKSGVEGSEYLLTRHPPAGNRRYGVASLGRLDFSRVFSWLARRLGTGPGSFSSKSVKRGYVTAAHIDRVSQLVARPLCDAEGVVVKLVCVSLSQEAGGCIKARSLPLAPGLVVGGMLPPTRSASPGESAVV